MLRWSYDITFVFISNALISRSTINEIVFPKTRSKLINKTSRIGVICLHRTDMILCLVKTLLQVNYVPELDMLYDPDFQNTYLNYI